MAFGRWKIQFCQALSRAKIRVSIVSGSDRREFPTLPIAVDLDTTKPWALEASKPGFADYHQSVTFDDGQAEKTFNIHLDAKSGSPSYVAPSYAAPSSAPSTPPPTPPASRSSAPAPPTSTPSPSAAASPRYRVHRAPS